MGGFSGGPPGTVTPGGPPGTGRRPVASAQKERVFDPDFATVAPRVDLEAPDIPIFDPRGGWSAVVDWWFSHDIPTEGLLSGGGLMIGPQEAAKGLNFLKDALLPLMAGDIGLAGVAGLGPFDPLPIPGGKIVAKGADVAKGAGRAIRGAVRGGDEAVEAAARGTWSVDHPEAELVPIEFFDDMQLEDEFFDRDLVDERWVERPEAIEGKGMEGLKSDMAEHGLDHPLTVRVDPKSGAMNLVDGNHRVVAARELGWGSVPVVVERGDDITRIRPSQVGMPTAVARTVVGETAPTLDAFTEMAGRGELHGAKGSTRIEWRTAEVRASPIEAQADTAFEMGVINGYSEDDIAHFYLALRAPWNKARTAKNVGAVRDDMRELAYEQFLEDRAEYVAKQSTGG